MGSISIIGVGNIGKAVAKVAADGGHDVQLVGRNPETVAQAASATGATSAAYGDALTGDVVVLAVPYPAVAEILGRYGAQLAGKVVVDPTNPLDFTTFDSLTVPADSSATAQIQALVPAAHVVKAFNTTFGSTIATGTVGPLPTTVLVAGDDADAKAAVIALATGGGLAAIDAGALSRARELEAIGFLQITLAAANKVAWTGGFGVVA